MELFNPLQRGGDMLAFNIRPLDTIMYNKRNFRKVAEPSVDQAILATATTSMPAQPIDSNKLLLRYLAVRSLKVAALTTDDAQNLYKLGRSLGFAFLDSPIVIVYF